MSDASVSLGLNADQFDRELAGAVGKMGNLGKSISGAFGGLGAGLSLGGIVAGLKSLTDYGAKIQDLSNQTGVSTDTLQHFGNAAEKNGSSLDAMGQAFRKLEIARSKALGGNEELASSFLQLGVGMQDLQKLDPEQIMLKLGRSSLNAADAVKILGKTALEIRPIIRGIADGTIELGAAIDKEMIAKLKKADDTYKDLWQNARVLGANALEGTWHGLDNLQKKLQDVHKVIVSDSKNAWQKAGDYFQDLFHGRVIDAAKDITGIFSPPGSGHDLGAGIRAANAAEQPAAKKGLTPAQQEEEDLKNDTIASIRERAKLSLGELAGRDAFGEGAVYRGKYIGGDILKAQQAEREKGTIEDLTFAGRDDEAKQHMDRFQALTSGIGSLRDKDKGIGGLADNVQSIEKSAQQIAKNTGQPIVNH